ncbi:hypothetical protein AVEN_269804-1 [Araneus ventricosus]|uniref:Uncharacterized protein n=1 Tax=Araneus ventricosus TaxID=182803 RepID=A0A4Y2JIW4_ARAVE|nr:hypothetical protein AVEN_269804-1 [Araneus ventricosus]
MKEHISIKLVCRCHPIQWKVLPLKLEIPDKAALHHLDERPVWCHPFQPIHLGESFNKDPKHTICRCDPRLLLLRLQLPPPQSDFPRLNLTHIPRPPRVIFAFRREHPSACNDRISLLWPNGLNGKQTMLDFQTFPVYANSHRIFTLTKNSGILCSKKCGVA